MISLEQIRLLEAKITKAVELIRTLKTENTSLRNTLDSAQSRMQDLEKLVGELKTDQREIEASILRAIQNLDQLEDQVSSARSDGPRSDGPAAPSEARGKRSSSSRSQPAGEPAEEGTAEPEQGEEPAAEGAPDNPSDEDQDAEKELDIF